MKKWFSNKPWKAWRTRKVTFIYMIVISSIAMLYGAIQMSRGIDVSGWLQLVLNFCKFIVGTGTVIILVPSVKDLANFLTGKFGSSDSSTEDETEG